MGTSKKQTRRPPPDPEPNEDPRLATLDRLLQRILCAAQAWGEAKDRRDAVAVGDAEDELRRAVTALSFAPRKWARPG
jgi:hypothetical protein